MTDPVREEATLANAAGAVKSASHLLPASDFGDSTATRDRLRWALDLKSRDARFELRTGFENHSGGMPR